MTAPHAIGASIRRPSSPAWEDRPRTLTIINGSSPPPMFSPNEMERRLARLRELMADVGAEAALLTSLHNICYHSDFLYCSFGRPYGLIVTPGEQVSISANIDGGQPARRTYGDNLVYTDWHRDNFFVAVQQVLGSVSRLGVEFDHLTLQAREKLAATIPGIDLVDVSPGTMKRRMIKSPEEIAVIREGARIADLGGHACVKAIGNDVPEYEVALNSTQAMVREIARTYPNAELMDTWTWFQSGINTDGAHNPVTTRRVRAGDILSLNTFPMIQGYYTALERTLFFEHIPSKRHLELWQINCEVHERGMELIKPGVRCCDIALELNEIYREHGLLEYRTFGYGHSFGVLSHYYGREAGLELREDIETVLQPSMVVSMEPMIVIPQGEPGAGGYREHDILVVTESGAEDVTHFPYGPDHNVVTG